MIGRTWLFTRPDTGDRRGGAVARRASDQETLPVTFVARCPRATRPWLPIVAGLCGTGQKALLTHASSPTSGVGHAVGTRWGGSGGTVAVSAISPRSVGARSLDRGHDSARPSTNRVPLYRSGVPCDEAVGPGPPHRPQMSPSCPGGTHHGIRHEPGNQSDQKPS